MSATQEYCTFLVDGELFGTPVSGVQEVMPYRATTPVPLAPTVVKGLMNLRGELVTAVDLRSRIGVSNGLGERQSMNVVVRTADGPVSLVVDEIGDVVEVDRSMFASVPATVQDRTRNFIRGVYQLPGRLLLELDIERIVDFSLLPPESATEAEWSVGTGPAERRLQ